MYIHKTLLVIIDGNNNVVQFEKDEESILVLSEHLNSISSSDNIHAVDVRPTSSKCRHFTLTTIICACALLVALFVSKIQIVFQLMGGKKKNKNIFLRFLF